MGKKVRKVSAKENYSSQASNNTTPLYSSDTDIIECSFVGDSKYNVKNNSKFGINRPSVTLFPNTASQTKKLQSSYGSIRSSNNDLRKPKKNTVSGDCKYDLIECAEFDATKCKQKKHFCNLNDEIKFSLRRSYKLVDDALTGKKIEFDSFETPRPSKNLGEPNSIVKKLISTIKKTPDGPYLSKSKLQNIEKWLNENEVETVCTPPFANLSVTPINSPKRRYSSRRKENKNSCYLESSLDSEVEDVLKVVYGSDWKRKNVHNQVRTEFKKKTKKFFSPSAVTKKNLCDFNSGKNNILNDKKLNLESKSDEKNNLDDSVLSGIKIISSDSSCCSSKQMKINIKTMSRKKKILSVANHSLESLCLSPVKKKPKITPLLEVESQKLSPKISTGEKFVSQIAFKTPKKTFLASLSVSTPTSKCHPDAEYYKINFKSKKEELVKKLFKLYNTEVFDKKLAEDMNFSWNVKLRGTAGYCYNKRITKSTGEVIRLSRIEFSSKIIDRADRLRDTMIHELCHAASWMIDGVLDGHGNVWNKWATKAMRRFSELPTIKRCHNYEIISKYIYRCTGCGYSIKRHSKSINTDKKRCGHCYGVLELLINKKKRGKKEIPEFDITRTLPTPNKFAMFVKENYRNVKSAKTNAKHSEIMKVLSQQYALTKNGSKSAKKFEDV